MNTQMERPKGHTTYDEDTHMHDQDVGMQIGHNEEHHGEKKSVLKKVKAKAKKIKDTIKEHVGHGHDHDENDEEDDEMDVDPEIHGTHIAQSVMPGQEGVARQHMHEPKVGGRTAGEGTAPFTNKPGDYHTFDPTNARHISGHDDAFGWSRTDTGWPNASDEQPFAPKNTPVTVHSSGHSTGILDMGKKGAPVKLGTLANRPVGVDKDPQALKDVKEHLHPANYMAKSTEKTTTGYDSTASQSFIPGLQRSRMGERTAMEGVIHAPERKPQGDYQASTTVNTSSYFPGQQETLACSGTDTGRLYGSKEQSNALKNTQVPTHSGFDSAASGEGVIHAPASKLQQGDYQTFDPSTTNYVPGQEETVGWSRTDTGRLNKSEELPNTSKATPTAAHTGRYYSMGEEKRETGKLGGILENPGHLEKDPQAPSNLGGKCHAENYQSKVTDPTGKGGEEIGVTPVLHRLDRMHIHNDSQPKSGEQESQFRTKCSPQDEAFSPGSHDQFSPEPVTYETSTFLQSTRPGSEGSKDMSKQNQGSYTEKISSAAAMMAEKAKQATSSIPSKLGYGGNSDLHSNDASLGLHDKQSEAGGYGGIISSATTANSDKAVQAKDAVTSKLSYGGAHEEQPPVQEGASKGGSIVGTVKEKMGPVYNEVGAVGSNMALKVQGSGSEYEVDSDSKTGPSIATDKGVSMKEYLVEKLTPGDEDKVLSEVITEALPLHNRKDDVSKVREEGEGTKVKIIGRVTESEEVAERLGRSEETNYDDAGTGMSSPGKGVMDRIREAASTWFQKSTEVPSQGAAEGNEDAPKIYST